MGAPGHAVPPKTRPQPWQVGDGGGGGGKARSFSWSPGCGGQGWGQGGPARPSAGDGQGLRQRNTRMTAWGQTGCPPLHSRPRPRRQHLCVATVPRAEPEGRLTVRAGEDPTQQGAASPQGASLWLHPGTRAQQQQGFLVHFLKNKIRNKVLLQKASPQLLRKAVNVSGSSRDRSFAMTEAPRRMER